MLVALAGLVAVSVALAGPARQGAAAKTVTITVKMTEFHFAFSKMSVKKGTTVQFKVTNKGKIEHNLVFTTLGKSTRLLQPGQSQTLKITFKKKGGFPYLCAVGRHAADGMAGTFKVK
jgi:plastocyanin